MISYLEFEKPVAELETRIAELRDDRRRTTTSTSRARSGGSSRRSADLLASTYAALTPWQKTQVARHPGAAALPRLRARMAFSDFMPLGGDRHYGEDQAIIGGFGAARRPQGHADRAREGPRHRKPPPPQLRHGQARGLPQGGPADGARRALRPAGGDAGRHLGRVSRASRPRSAARPRRSPARPRPAWRCRCRWSPRSSARAARAARWRWPAPSGC